MRNIEGVSRPLAAVVVGLVACAWGTKSVSTKPSVCGLGASVGNGGAFCSGGTRPAGLGRPRVTTAPAVGGDRAWAESWAYPARSDRKPNESGVSSLYSGYRCHNAGAGPWQSASVQTCRLPSAIAGNHHLCGGRPCSWSSGRSTATSLQPEELLRGWVRGVLAPAQALGHVDVNAAGEVIDAALPKTPKNREHRRALPYADVPAALEAVEASGAGPVVKAVIRFTALTAVRSGEARGATWRGNGN